MNDPRKDALRWLDQAENDLAFARHAMAGDFFHQVCFIAQQSAEKALKSVAYNDGARSVIGHSLVALLVPLTRRHPALGKLGDAAAELDLFYIPTRYPNGLVEGTPHSVFTRSQAERALEAAVAFLDAVRVEIRAG
jgi:HEPN domain-containing protein